MTHSKNASRGKATFGLAFMLLTLLVGLAVLMPCPSMRKPLRANPGLYRADSPLPLRFDYTPQTLTTACDKAIKDHATALDEIAKITVPTFPLVIAAFELANTNFDQNTSPLSFLGQVSDNAALRKAGIACDEKISKHFAEVFGRVDLYKAVTSAFNASPKLDASERFLALETIDSFERNGTKLPPAQRAEFLQLQKRLIELQTLNNSSLNNWKDPLFLTREELQGMTEDYLKALKIVNGKYEVTLAYPHALPLLEKCKRADTRRRLMEKFDRRGGMENVKRFEEAVVLRTRMAQLLGYKTFADLQTSDLMSGTPKAVTDFLADLRLRLQPAADREAREFLDLKIAETGDKSLKRIDPWDSRYYRAKVKETRFNVDEDALQPYFPLDRVLAGMFKIYQTLMDVSFEAMPQAPLWHKDVRAYAVRDRASGKIMSYFYMDLFPREGKYGHAAAFGLVPGHVLADGTYQGGVSSIVANFTAPTSDQPSLLRFDEVETLFHEFGHIMHGVLTRSRYGSFAGTAVKRDFVETLSQIFENWVWDKNMLRMMSGHHKTGAPIPDKLLNALVQSRLANVGTNMMRQVHLASVDMIYYTSTPKSAADVHAVDTWNKTQLEYTGLPATPNTHYIGAFGHVMSGYASGYYSYLWSEVFAHDMFSRFRQGGFLSTSLGRELRYKVLEKGGMEPPMNLLKDFLGRLPNADAFMRSYKL